LVVVALEQHQIQVPALMVVILFLALLPLMVVVAALRLEIPD
jgi:hypothetical protein